MNSLERYKVPFLYQEDIDDLVRLLNRVKQNKRKRTIAKRKK